MITASQLSCKIADHIMTMHKGDRCERRADRIALMKTGPDGEINLGGRGKVSLRQCIEEELDTYLDNMVSGSNNQ